MDLINKEIISKKACGMMARAESVSSKLMFAFDKRCSYYEVLYGVIVEIFHKAPTKLLSHKESLVASNHPADPTVLALEEHLMAEVHAQQRRNMTREQRNEEDAMLASSNEELKEIREVVCTKAKLHNKESMKYALNIVRSVVKTPGKCGITVISLQALQSALPATAVVVGPAVLGLSALMGPLALIGLVTMVTKGVNIALGPSLARLYGPLVLMVDQRVLMALEGLEIDSFY